MAQVRVVTATSTKAEGKDDCGCNFPVSVKLGGDSQYVCNAASASYAKSLRLPQSPTNRNTVIQLISRRQPVK
jgi:hypothetical protein